eukprot:460663-Prorocentrum_minimum.AAC.5
MICGRPASVSFFSFPFAFLSSPASHRPPGPVPVCSPGGLCLSAAAARLPLLPQPRGVCRLPHRPPRLQQAPGASHQPGHQRHPGARPSPDSPEALRASGKRAGNEAEAKDPTLPWCSVLPQGAHPLVRRLLSRSRLSFSLARRYLVRFGFGGDP